MSSSAKEFDLHRNDTGLSRTGWFAFPAATLLVAAALGVFARSTFDDEIFTLRLIDRFTPGEILDHLTSGWERHGPLSTLMYELLSPVLSPGFMRGVALVLTAMAFTFLLDLTLRAVPAAPPRQRLMITGAFLLHPLLYGVGDALRSYPLTAFLIAWFAWLYLRGDDRLVWLAGIPLGLAASTTVTPVVVYLAFAIHRYGIRRSFGMRDVWFHATLAVSALPGIINVLRLRGDEAPGIFDNPSESAVQFVVGFLGGMRVGISRFPLLIPLGVVIAVGSWRAWTSRDGGNRLRADVIRFSMLLAALSVAFVLLFDRGQARTYLYLAPFVTALAVIGLLGDRRLSPKRVALVVASGILAFAAFAANYQSSIAPLKRNLAIPYPTVVEFVESNAAGQTLLITDDGVLARELSGHQVCVATERFAAEEVEASPLYLPPTPDCIEDSAPFATVIVVETSFFSDSAVLFPIAADARSEMVTVASATFGEDRDASLKSRFGGKPLPSWLLRATVLRR